MTVNFKIGSEFLINYWPMKRINDEGLEKLADRVKVAVLPPGKVLLKKDKKLGARFYLLEGEIKLKSVYGHVKTLTAEQPEAKKPIDMALPELDMATSKTDVRLMAVVPSDFESLQKEHPRIKERKLPHELAHLAALMAGENPVVSEMNKYLEAETLELPEISEVTFQVLNKAADPATEPRDIGDIIEEDDRLATRLIKIANSPQFAGSKRAFSCFEAVARIGIKTTCSIVISGALKSLFEADDFKVQKLLNETWNRSIQVAADAFILAKYTGAVDPEDALLAGLLHEIGVAPICRFAVEHKELMWKSKQLEEAIKTLKCQIGSMVIAKWEMDDEFRIVVEEVHDPYRDSEYEYADLCDVIQVAKFYNAPTSDPYNPKQLFGDLRSYQKLNPGALAKDFKLAILEENKDESIGLIDAIRG